MAFFLWLAIYMGAFIGWALNIVALVSMSGISGLLLARAVGIFLFPLGVVLGYFF